MKDIENIFMIDTLKHPNTTPHKITKIIGGISERITGLRNQKIQKNTHQKMNKRVKEFFLGTHLHGGSQPHHSPPHL